MYNLLLADGYKQEEGHFKILGNPDFEDVIDVLVNDEFRIGIIGMGDYQRGEGSLKKLLAVLESKNCNVAICACRNTSGIEAAIKNYKEHTFIDKTLVSEQSQYRIQNVKDALSILDVINPGGVEHFVHAALNDKETNPAFIDWGNTNSVGSFMKIEGDISFKNIQQLTNTIDPAQGGEITLFYGTNRISNPEKPVNDRYGVDV
ncbi:MAG: hypothetical protein JST76_10195 [Bacteroidetes bacterium]|nr:hypothetical protein [Bacteroidota bacterium]